MADVAAAAASLQSLHAHNGAGLLHPPGRVEQEGSPSRSHDDTRASSAEDDKNGANEEGAGRPSTVSGSSSVSGGNNGASIVHANFAPLTAKKGPQSFFSGSKIKHLKKADGIPLWRSDIQYEFLRAVFKDTEPVFTNVYDGQKGYTFADVYVDAMARSSKTSKILKDKLLTERENALNMAMVCLLVNVGRMNTTLNFFPEMKAQLRTYHAIPSLQAHTDSNAYKQLQDAPRLKSILKGACEDRAEPQTLEQIISRDGLRTNPINLVFILSTYAPKVSECHFPENMDFYDLIMRITLSSKSRARAFLWLMWLYLESDFTEQMISQNPFGKGKPSRDKTRLWCVPEFEYLTEEQAAKENVDTEEELAYGEAKREERKRLLGEIHSAPPGSGRGRGRKDKSFEAGASPDVQSPSGSPPPGSSRRAGVRPHYMYDYDSEPRTRSVSPENHYTPANGIKSNRRIPGIVKVPNDIGPPPAETPKSKGGRPKNSAKRTADGEVKLSPRIIITKGGRPLATLEGAYSTTNRSLASAERSSPMILERAGPRQRLTTHQIAVQRNRRDRVNHAIDRQLHRLDRRRLRLRMKQGAIARAWSRIKDLEEPLVMSDDEERSFKHKLYPIEVYDEDGNVVKREDDDDHPHPTKRTRVDRSRRLVDGSASRGPAGLIPRIEEEMGTNDDFGEEAISLAAALRRTERRLKRWGEIDRHAAGATLDDAQQLPENTTIDAERAEDVENEEGEERRPATREEAESDEDDDNVMAD